MARRTLPPLPASPPVVTRSSALSALIAMAGVGGCVAGSDGAKDADLDSDSTELIAPQVPPQPAPDTGENPSDTGDEGKIPPQLPPQPPPDTDDTDVIVPQPPPDTGHIPPQPPPQPPPDTGHIPPQPAPDTDVVPPQPPPQPPPHAAS